MNKYVDSVNNETREAVVRLYGEIGRQIDADLFAQELAALDDRADTVHLHINSPGGDVVSGLSIVSAMQSMRAFIHAHVDGIAASMAAVVAIAADKVSIQDYGKMMIHDPYFSNKDIEMNDKTRKALSHLTDTLQTILSRRGCKKEKIASLMSAETWFTAEEAKTAGLVDEIVSTPRKEELKSLTTAELLSRIENEYQPLNINEMDLTKIASKLGLPSTASERQILDAIQAGQTALAAERSALIAHYLALGKKIGTVSDKNEERMKKLAAADFGLFAEMVTDVPDGEEEKNGQGEEKTDSGVGRLSAALAELKAKGIPTVDAHDWDWYQRNNPKALAEMETKEPQKFKRLLDEYENKL